MGLRSQSDNFISMLHGPCEHKTCGVNWGKWFTFKKARLHGSHLLLQQNHAKKSRWMSGSNSGSNPKQASQLNTELPPRDINHTFRIGNFLFGTFVCFKNNLPSSGWSMDIGGGTLQHSTRYSSNQNFKRSTMGEGQRSRIARDPRSRTLGVIPRGDLRHFVVEGIKKTSDRVASMMLRYFREDLWAQHQWWIYIIEVKILEHSLNDVRTLKIRS